MHPNPAEEWQRLTKLYGEMSDGQLLELAESYSDLTEIAQPILRDEMKKRGLGEPQASETESPISPPVFGRWSAPDGGITTPGAPDDVNGGSTDFYQDAKMLPLCECEDSDQVEQLGEALRRQGIESWSQNIPHSMNLQAARIFVAADQLEEAREIASRPIPQDIIDQSKVKVEDFVTPACPRCGASDPLLESVDPVNTWSCDVCGATWADPAAADSAPSESVL
jgi:ribosomal protein L37AE/L43A